MQSKFQISQKFKKNKSATMRALQNQYQNTRECQAFYAGDFMQYKDRVQFTDVSGVKRKAMVQFNKVKPYVNAVKGFAAQNRRKAKYAARIQGDVLQEKYSTYANALSDYIRDNANADQIETQQDGDMFINGYAAVETAMTYGLGQSTTDPNGQIIMGRLDPLLVGWDPAAKGINLLDSRWVFYQKDFDLDEAMDLFDDKDEEDFEVASADDGMDDNGYEWYARGGRYNKIKETNVDWADEKQKMVKVFFYQWLEYETFYRAHSPVAALKNPIAIQAAQEQLDIIAQEMNDPADDDMFQFDPRAATLTFDDKVKARLVEVFGEYIQPFEFKRKVFYTSVISGDHVFTAYRSPCQQGFTIKFKTGDYDSKNKIWTGMVNSMKEPVLYYNKALTELMFIIGANSKGGVMYEKGTIEDIQSFEAKYAKTDANVEVMEGALAEGRIQPKRQPYQPNGYEQIIQLSNDSIPDVNGIDRTFLGSSENKDETGILQKRRIKQVVSTLACYFDSITLYSKEHARLLLDFMRTYAANNDGGLFRIIGQNGRDEFVQISSDKLVNEYDVTIQEAPQSPEDKQELAAIINQMAQMLLSVGDVSTAKVLLAYGIKCLPLDQIDIQQITQVLQPQSPQIDPAYVQQLQQQLQAVMSDVTQADVKEKLSRMMLNMAKVDESHANINKIQADANKANSEAHKTALDSHVTTHQPRVFLKAS